MRSSADINANKITTTKILICDIYKCNYYLFFVAFVASTGGNNVTKSLVTFSNVTILKF